MKVLYDPERKWLPVGWQMALTNLLSCIGFIAHVLKASDNESVVGDDTSTDD